MSEPEPCPICGYEENANGTLVPSGRRVSEYPCQSCLWGEPDFCGQPYAEDAYCTRPNNHEGECA